MMLIRGIVLISGAVAIIIGIAKWPHVSGKKRTDTFIVIFTGLILMLMSSLIGTLLK